MDIWTAVGEDRLAALFTARADQTADKLIAEVNKAVVEWTRGAPPADDVTLVVARRLVAAQAAGALR